MSPCRCHQAPVPRAQVPRGGGRPCARRRMPIISPVRHGHPGQECEITAGASRGDTQGTCRCHRHPATPSGAPPREPGAPHPQGEAAGAALTPLTLLEAWRDGGGGAGGQAPVGTMARGWGSSHGTWHPVGTFRCAHTCDTRAGTRVHARTPMCSCTRVPEHCSAHACGERCAHRAKPPHPSSPIPGWVWGHDSWIGLLGGCCPQTGWGHSAIAGPMAGSHSAWRPAPAPPGRLAVQGWGPHGGDGVA